MLIRKSGPNSALPFGCSKQSWKILCELENNENCIKKCKHGEYAAGCRQTGQTFQRFGRKGQDGFIIDFVRI
jgi:hypothetical protein